MQKIKKKKSHFMKEKNISRISVCLSLTKGFLKDFLLFCQHLKRKKTFGNNRLSLCLQLWYIHIFVKKRYPCFSVLKGLTAGTEILAPLKQTKKKLYITQKEQFMLTSTCCIVTILLCRGVILMEKKGTIWEMGVPALILLRLLLPAIPAPSMPSALHEPQCCSCQRFCKVASLSLLNDVLFK